MEKYNDSDRYYQEETSAFFNAILRPDVTPLTVDDLPAETIDRFNDAVRSAFPEEADLMIGRIRYLIPYILQSIDWQKYGLPLEGWQFQYYYHRDRFLEKTQLDYDIFLRHEPLQQAIADLGLEPEPTFEFILFLKYYFGMRSELRYSALEQLLLAQKALTQLPADKSASIDINVGGRHFRLSNTEFVKRAITSIDTDQFRAGAFINDFREGAVRDKLRAIDYYMLKTLLDFLPIKTAGEKTGLYTQAERNFGLSVLSLCGRLPDTDREGECSKENNATFDKLMREFRDTPIPFAMHLFL